MRIRPSTTRTSSASTSSSILVCAHGESTSLAAATLQELGFSRATDLVGGFAAWQAAGLPVHAAPEVDPGVGPGMGDPDS